MRNAECGMRNARSPNSNQSIDSIRSIRSILSAAAVWLALAPLCTTAQQAQPASPIPPARITALEQELAQGMTQTSVIDVRRACKSVARQAAALLALKSAKEPLTPSDLSRMMQRQAHTVQTPAG